MSLGRVTKVDLSGATVLVLDDDELCLDLTARIVRGFGIRTIHRCQTSDEAKAAVSSHAIDLMLVDMVLGEEDGCDWVKWLRRSGIGENYHAAVIMVTDHGSVTRVARARDSGANFLVAKPLTPSVLLERVVWVSQATRKFVEADGYAGPDRRFKFAGVPPGTKGRRADDLPAEVGEASGSNLSQDEIDSFLMPQRIG